MRNPLYFECAFCGGLVEFDEDYETGSIAECGDCGIEATLQEDEEDWFVEGCEE